MFAMPNPAPASTLATVEAETARTPTMIVLVGTGRAPWSRPDRTLFNHEDVARQIKAHVREWGISIGAYANIFDIRAMDDHRHSVRVVVNFTIRTPWPMDLATREVIAGLSSMTASDKYGELVGSTPLLLTPGEANLRHVLLKVTRVLCLRDVPAPNVQRSFEASVTRHVGTPHEGEAAQELRSYREHVQDIMRATNPGPFAQDLVLIFVSKLNDLLHARPSGLID